jgi:hypothetical protein
MNKGFLYVEANIKPSLLAQGTPFALHAHIIEPADPFYEKLKPVIFCLVALLAHSRVSLSRFPQRTVI